MKKLKKQVRGTFTFDKGIVSVTDPCYSDDVWCRMDNVKIIPGKYNCISYIDTENKRTFICQICLQGHNSPQQNSKKESIGSIGVDAGMAGFYQDKPNYSDEEWYDFCEACKANNFDYLINEHGFCTSSGYGDGSYDVYAYRCKDGIYCLEIIF